MDINFPILMWLCQRCPVLGKYTLKYKLSNRVSCLQLILKSEDLGREVLTEGLDERMIQELRVLFL